MWWSQNKWKVVAPVLIVAVLAGAFWYGGGAPGLQGWAVNKSSPPPAAATPAVTDTAAPSPSKPAPPTPDTTEQPGPTETSGPSAPADTATPAPTETTPAAETPTGGLESRPGGTEGGMTADEKAAAAAAMAGGSSPGVMKGSKDYSESQGMVIDAATGKDQYLTDPVPEGKPLPVEPQDTDISTTAYSCTLSISCATILDHIDWLDPEKVELVPEDGWILEPITVTFYEGESVFNVLQRTCRQKGIHMEFESIPLYNSAYIEGIHNLYEFDCGELSGWMYKVNEWFPNYGCSRYQLKDGDVICWEYTCDLGVDVGGYYATGG
ncbi:MAG TPA: DUF4430 domain-containing protein [Pseudoflavonifractor sp.]|nr:DUF4430 domain-containing protein [Pseudoflavonifractor sp.]